MVAFQGYMKPKTVEKFKQSMSLSIEKLCQDYLDYYINIAYENQKSDIEINNKRYIIFKINGGESGEFKFIKNYQEKIIDHYETEGWSKVVITYTPVKYKFFHFIRIADYFTLKFYI